MRTLASTEWNPSAAALFSDVVVLARQHARIEMLRKLFDTLFSEPGPVLLWVLLVFPMAFQCEGAGRCAGEIVAAVFIGRKRVHF